MRLRLRLRLGLGLPLQEFHFAPPPLFSIHSLLPGEQHLVATVPGLKLLPLLPEDVNCGLDGYIRFAWDWG